MRGELPANAETAVCVLNAKDSFNLDSDAFWKSSDLDTGPEGNGARNVAITVLTALKSAISVRETLISRRRPVRPPPPLPLTGC